MTRSNNALRKHPGFLHAAKGAVEIYLQLDKNPQAALQPNGKHGTSGVKLSMRSADSLPTLSKWHA